MKTPVTIRAAQLEDIPVVCGFVIQLAEYEKLAHEVQFSEPAYRRLVFEERPFPGPEVFLAETNVPVGFSLVVQILSQSIYVEDLFVVPSARGEGVGIALLSAVAKEAVSRSVHQLEWACLDWNEPSIAFYRSLGASVVADRAIWRIAGSSLTSRRDRLRGKSYLHVVDRVVELGSIPSEVDPRVRSILGEVDPYVRGLELVDSRGTATASLFYTLNFTTFLGAPVVLVTAFVAPNPKDLIPLLDHAISVSPNCLRVDVRINPKLDASATHVLACEFGAVEMLGWIPFSLMGDSLVSLANRTNGEK